MTQGLIKCLTGLFQVLADANIIDIESQSERVNKHTNRIGNLQIRTTTADGTEIYLAIIGIA